MNPGANPRIRSSVTKGATVDIVRKEDQRTGKKTRGIVSEILTTSASHPHGIKVRLSDGKVGRVAAIISTPEQLHGSTDRKNVKSDAREGI